MEQNKGPKEKAEASNKYNYLLNVESSLMDEMKSIDGPIVGLSYIHEIKRKEPNAPPIYNCFLCHASMATIPLLIEHLLSLKHRSKYLKENDPDQYNLISATNLKKQFMEPLVEEAVLKLEEIFGPGTAKVKQEKMEKPVNTYSIKKTHNLIKNSEKRTFNMDDSKSYKNLRFDPNQSVWKSQCRERTRSREFEDSYRTRFRSKKSPRSFHEREHMYPEEEYSMARSASFDMFSRYHTRPQEKVKTSSSSDHLKSRFDPNQSVWKSQCRERTRSREFEDNYRTRFRSRSPRSFHEREHMYPEEEYSMARSAISRYSDYNQDYLEPPRKNFPDKTNNPNSRYHTRPQEKVKTSSSSDHLKSRCQLLPPDFPSSGSNMTLEDVLRIISTLNVEDCYQLLDAGVDACTRNMQSLGDVIFILQHMKNIRTKMMQNVYYGPLMHFLSQAKNM